MLSMVISCYVYSGFESFFSFIVKRFFGQFFVLFLAQFLSSLFVWENLVF